MIKEYKSLSDAPIGKLKGVSVKIIQPLAHLGIHTVKDLLLHLPFRYDDFSHIKAAADIRPGETATMRGKISTVQQSRSWKKKMHILQVVVADSTGSMKAVWYNQPFLARTLVPDKMISLSGKTNVDGVMQNPAHEMVTALGGTTHTGRLVPVYPETSGITSRWLRYLIKNALPAISSLDEILPLPVLKQEGLPALKDAVRYVHFPSSAHEAGLAKKRFSFEELFLLQLLILQARADIKQAQAQSVPFNLDFVKRFVGALPFQLTNAQRRAAWEIIQDMEKETPMNRLLEGDVGSGKTVVAAIAAFNAALDNHQCAFMAPTEILANQHFDTFIKLAPPFAHKQSTTLSGNHDSSYDEQRVGLVAHSPFSIGLLTGSGTRLYDAELDRAYEITRTELAKKIANGTLHILIGTHALITDGLLFPNLALVVLDEQHRFGVAQRAALLDKKKSDKVPHFLSMTATPIPRTLALALYGDLDISILNEMPKNRKKMETRIVPASGRAKEYAFIRAQVKAGRQAFVICPRIEVSESAAPRTIAQAEVKSVKEEYGKLSEEIFPELRIAMLHGKMKPKEKEKVMSDFKDGKTDILVSTSVVEVGVDVPNTSVMLIEGSERFGLAQLHQFRGRVGRAEHQSYCLLFTGSESAQENRRLSAMVKSSDGFALAEQDLKIRGPGDLLGGRQSGLPDLTMASLTDVVLIKSARDAAAQMLAQDPTLTKSPKLKKHLAQFNAKVHFE